jgi:hypothetical protein
MQIAGLPIYIQVTINELSQALWVVISWVTQKEISIPSTSFGADSQCT